MTWEHALAFRQSYEPTLNELHETERVISHLRSIFGEHVMDLPVQLLEKLLNAAPWTYRWLRWLSDSIRRVEPMGESFVLRQRLINPLQYDEALSVLQVADRLVTAGFNVRFDAPALVDGNTKVPDILVKDAESNVTFHCEVSVLYSAQRQVDQSRVVERLAWPLMFQDQERIAWAGRLLRPIAKDEVEGIHHRIVWEMLEVRKDRTFHEVNIDNTLLLALAPTGDAERVAQWAREHGFVPDSFGGPSPGADNSDARLQMKVNEKAKQLPPSQPNLLVIFAHDLFLCVDSPVKLLPLGAAVISRHDRIALLVLTSEDFGHGFPQAMEVDGNISAISDRDGLNHYNLIINNPSCSVSLPITTRDKIRLAFSC